MRLSHAYARVGSVVGAVLLACTLLGCVRWDEYTARSRAANDFGVSASELEVSEIGNHSFEISGNGSWATYTCISNGHARSSDWSCLREAEPLVVHHDDPLRSLPPLPPRPTGAEPKPRSFDVGAARAKLAEVNLEDCRSGGVHGYGRARVTFAPTGRVEGVDVASPEHVAPSDAACIEGHYREATVPSFDGAPVSAATTFYVR
jgi:hypothetical protein